MELKTAGLLLGLFFTVGAVVFAVTVYWVQGEIDANIAYMALYYDGLAVELYDTGAGMDAVVMVQQQASKFCDLYYTERRTLEEWRYGPVCDVVYKRGERIALCYVEPELCIDSQVPELEELIGKADELALELMERRPYLSNAFSENPTVGDRCYVGKEEVPCPWTQ